MKYTSFKIPDNCPAFRVCNTAAVYCKIKHIHISYRIEVVKVPFYNWPLPLAAVFRIYIPAMSWDVIITPTAIVPQPFVPGLDCNFFIPCRNSPSKIIVVAVEKDHPQFPRRHLARYTPIIRWHFIQNASFCNSIYGIRRNGIFSIQIVL